MNDDGTARLMFEETKGCKMTNELLPGNRRRQLCATRMAGRPRQPEGRLPPRVRAPEMWRIDPAFWRRPRTTPPCWPSATWNTPVSTSSPMVRFGAKAIRTGLRPRWVVSTQSGTAIDRTATPTLYLVAGPITRERPIEVDDVKFPCRHRPEDKDHPARPLYNDAAGTERSLRYR